MTSPAGEQANQVFVHLLLHADSGHWFLPDPDVTLSFTVQLSLTCNATNTEATFGFVTQDPKSNVSFDPLVDILALAAGPAALSLLFYYGSLVNDAVEAAFQPTAKYIVLNSHGICPKLNIDEDRNGNASIGFRLF